MPLPKPTAKTNWTVGNPNFATVTQEPTAQKKEDGWFADERPAREFMNWLFYIEDQWIDYFESVTDETFATYDAVVGAGKTYATLALAIAGEGANARIFVLDPFTVDATINFNKSGQVFMFHPNAVYTKGTATKAFSISQNTVKISGAKLSGAYTTGIEIQAGVKNCMITENHFGPTVVTDVDDLGDNNLVTNNLHEVV